MRIAVIGGSGSVGAFLLPEALRRGHDVVAVTRDRRRISRSHPRLRVVESELGDRARLADAFIGADAVVVLLGDGLADGTAAVVAAMRDAGVTRLEAVTGFGASAASRRQLDPAMRAIVMGVRLATLGEFVAKERQDAIIRESGLEYTIVQPPTLTSNPATGAPRHGDYRGKSILGSVSRSDLAAFLLDNMELRRYVGESVYIQD